MPVFHCLQAGEGEGELDVSNGLKLISVHGRELPLPPTL